MNKRKLFGLLAALPVAGALFGSTGWGKAQAYVPRMRETGQWDRYGYYEDEETGELHALDDMYYMRHDVAFTDQWGEQNQIGVDCSFDHEPSEEELIRARELAWTVIKRNMKMKNQIAVGPSEMFKLDLPRAVKLSHYV